MVATTGTDKEIRRSMLSNRIKTALRRMLGTAAAMLPPDRGPAPWRRVIGYVRVIEAELLLRRAKDYHGAEHTATPVLANPWAASRAWAVIAGVREHRGDLTGAIDAARRSTSTDPVGLAALVQHRRLARVLGLDDEADALLTRIFAGVRRMETGRARPQRAIITALVHSRAWDELARFAEHGTFDLVTESPPTKLPVDELRRAATKALSAGYTAAAVVLARIVLASRPDNAEARRILEDGSDQLEVVAKGWPKPPAGPTPYQPDPSAVLSVLAQSVPVTSGGYATRSHGVLTSLVNRGWRPEAVTRLGFPYDRWKPSETRVVPATDVVDGIAYHRLLDDGVRSYPQYPLQSYVGRFADRLVEHAVRHRAQLLHASSFHVNGLATASAARRLGLPFVYEMRGLEELMKISRDPTFGDTDRYRFLTTLENEICHQADRVFVITEALRGEMVNRGIPAERLVVLPNGVHVEQFAPRERDAELERELKLAGKTVIGYAGGLVDYEGVDLLLEAVAALRERRSDFHLLVVGDGHYQSTLHTLAGRLRLGDVVTLTGRVPHAKVGRYLSLFDIAPFPRQPLPVCELISPIKPFESMAMGKAVIVSSVAALTEIVTDQQTGLVFGKGDVADLSRALEQLLDSPDLRRSLGAAARDWVIAERDWSTIVGVVDSTYRDVLDRAASDRVR